MCSFGGIAGVGHCNIGFGARLDVGHIYLDGSGDNSDSYIG